MKKNKKREKRLLGPVFTIMFITLLIILLSSLLSVLGFEGQQTAIHNGVLETSLVTINNIFTPEGIRFLFGNVITNLTIFEPLVILIIALIGIGIGEKSGLFKAAFSPCKKWKNSTITMITLFISIISSFFGEYSYAFLIPLAGVFYKYVGRNSRLGILTTFLGIGVGYGTGIIFNYTDALLGSATQISAALEVDQNYTFHLLSTIYIMLGSTAILTIIGTIIIERLLASKYPKKTPLLDEDVRVSKKGLFVSSITFLIFSLIIIYFIIPGLPGSGMLLDTSAATYIEQLMGTDSPFGQCFIYLLVMALMICGLLYGYISRNIKSSNDYSLGLSKGFDNVGYVFVLMFFASQMISIFNWTNLGTVLSSRMISFLSTLQFSGIPLIVTLFIIVLLMGIMIPSTETKWSLLNPLVVPLFMRSNITPDFTQFIFRAADGLSRCITPMFGYFIVMLAFLQKYNYDEENKITIFGTIRKIMPSFLLFVGVWLLILIGWYIVGLPIGVGTYPTL